MPVTFGVLGPVAAWDRAGAPIALRGPRHRAVLARLLVARGRVVPVATLIEHLWPDPPDDARGTVQTFVSALRRAPEPDRRPRTPARLLVTEGGGVRAAGGRGLDRRPPLRGRLITLGPVAGYLDELRAAGP